MSTAFLCADIDSEIYVVVPRYFSDALNNPETYDYDNHDIRQAMKCVPGIPQGPRLWHKKSHGIFSGQALTQCKSDYALYYCLTRHLFLIVWVDDLFLFYPRTPEPHAQTLWRALQQQLDLDDWEDVDDCLGCQVVRDRQNRKLCISQRKSIETGGRQ